jgi:hypothetical protein
LIRQAIPVGRQSARGTAEGVTHNPQTSRCREAVVADELGQAPAGQAYGDSVVSREERGGIVRSVATAQMIDEVV